MTNEEKQLLLKDLCARLPYDVCVHVRYKTGEPCYGKLIPRDIQWFIDSVLKCIFDVICRVLALFYAVTVIPAMFLLRTSLVTAAFLLGAVEWVFRGDAPWCNAAIGWLVEDGWQFVLDIFKKLVR